MASTLASQLQDLAVSGGSASHSRPSTRPSLLFHPSQAADIDLHTIFTLSQAGLDELVTIDNRFEPFKKTLFSLESSRLDRELQPMEFNQRLDKSISSFLRVLNGYAMLTAAHQVLEYLIRRYKIQVYNVDDIVLCVLPYHDTSFFVRVVQLLQIQNTRWQFLEAVKETGAAPPRSALVLRCTSDMGVLESICELGISYSGTLFKSRITTSFVSVVLIETLTDVSSVSTDLVNKILPFVLKSFGKGIAEEYRVGALMVVGALVNRATLALSLVEELFHHVARAFQKASETDGVPLLQLHVMVMIQLIQTQEVHTFPSKSFKALVKVRDFLPILNEMVQKFKMQKFLTLYVQAHVTHCFQNDHYKHAFLDTIKSLSLEAQVVPSVLMLLQVSFGEADNGGNEVEVSNSRTVVKTILQALETRFPAEVDKAIALHFQKKKEAQGREKKDDPVFLFLSDVFHGSLHVPMAETRMSVYLSLDHPQASIREKAIGQLSELASTQEPTEEAEMHAVLREAYLRRLHDDDYSVIRAVLSVDDLVKIIPAEPLFKALVSILSKCHSDVMTGERSIKDIANTVSKMVIELLGSGFVVQRPEYVQQVASLFLEYLLQKLPTWRLNKYILKAAGSLPFPLFTDLALVYGDTNSEVEDGAVKSKTWRKIRQAAVNEKIISSLGANVKKDSSAFLSLLDNARWGDGSHLILGIVLLQCLQQPSEVLDTEFVNCSLRWLRDEWAQKGPGTELRQDLQMIDYHSWDDATCVPVDFYHRLEAEPSTTRAELLLRILHSLVMCVPQRPSSNLEVGQQDTISELFMLFTNSVWPFKHHVNLLMSRFPIAETLPFLAKYFTQEGSAVPASVQVHSLNVLASELQKISELKTEAVDRKTFMHLQSVLSPILVALASYLQDVRVVAVQCLKHLFTAWDNHVLKREKAAKDLEEPLLNPTIFGTMLQALIEAQGTIITSGEYLGELFKELYGPKEELLAEVEMRDASDLRSVLTFLVNQAFQLTSYGQRMILKLLQGIARGLAVVRATHETRSKLVERRKLRHLQGRLNPVSISERLTRDEILLLEILLQMYASITPAEASQVAGVDGEELWLPFFDCLRVDGGSFDDPAVWQPCCAVLNCLTPDFYETLTFQGQDFAFQALISLSKVPSEIIRSTVHRVLQNTKISASTVARHLNHLLEEGMKAGKTPRKTKRRKQSGENNIIMIRDRWPANGKLLPDTATMLELLFSKTDLKARQVLLAPLFKLLKNCLSGSWPESDNNEALIAKDSSVLHVQQLVFMSLDNIVKSLAEQEADTKDSIKQADFDVKTVVTAINTASDATNRNYALALLTSLGKLIPDAVLQHLLDVLSVIGESTLTQDDNHSHQVVNDMLIALVPAWLAVKKDPTAVLQVFVRILPRIPAHRRMAAITSLLSVIKEEEGLHIFVFLLLQKANSVAREEKHLLEVQVNNGPPEESKEVHDSLEFIFAGALCRQYSPTVEFPALVRLLETAKVDGGLLETEVQTEFPNEPPRPGLSQWTLQQLSTDFVAKRLHSPDLHHIGERFDDGSNNLQNSFVALVEQVLKQLQILDYVEGKSDARESYSLTPKVKNGIQGAAVSLLDGLNIMMAPTEYLKGISSMMKHSDSNIRRKVLRMFTSKIKEMDRAHIKGGKKKAAHVVPETDGRYSAEELELHVRLVSDITSSIQMRYEVDSVGNMLAAIEALDASAQRLADKIPDIFVSALPILVEQNLPLSKNAPRVKCLATIIGKVGPRALPALPATASEILDIADKAFDTPGNKDEDDAYDHNKVVLKRSELILAVLDALDALLGNLGAFLTPYLQRIVAVLVLRPQLVLNSSTGIAKRAAAVRASLPTNTPVRLLLDPVITTYQSAIEKGEDSVVALFGVIGGMTATADKSSVAAYHVRIFDFCVSALDLGGKGSFKLSSLARVETAIINAVVSLVMKLSETTFKPLFVKTLEWAQSVTESEGGTIVNQSLDRNVVFYKLVNQLSSKLRSVFVPYLQYLMNGCVHHLTGGLSETDTTKPKKKMKTSKTSDKEKGTLSPSEWHLRHLILSTLQQCFLYDTINFLDAPKFQLLLAPVVAQIMVGPPSEVPTVKQGNETDLPSVQETDDVLVSCLGQMALTAGTDLLWKPLNHEVLMCTRVENTRARLLGLRVVKFLAEHLKEDYLVLLPETIPFLAELLEDVDLTVVSQTQEVVKLLEDLSGEELAQYF